MKERLNKIEEPFRHGSEMIFMILLALYITNYLINRVWWNVSVPRLDMTMAYFKLILETAAHWVMGMALSFCFFFWKEDLDGKNLRYAFRKMSDKNLILMLGTGIALGFVMRLLMEQHGTIYAVVISTGLILLASGKSHTGIVCLFFVFFAADVAVALMGLVLGYTYGGAKVGAYGTGLSLGMTYPNTWARIFFLAVVLGWYIFLSMRHRFWTFLLFWLAAVPVQIIVKCRTIALLMLLFPLVVWIADYTVKRMQATDDHEGETNKRNTGKQIISILLIAMPFICFCLTLFLGSQMELLHRLTYGNYLRNMSKRFVQAGIAVKEYGLPLFGKEIDLGHNIAVTLNGETETLYILDNGYIGFALSRGLIWLFAMMAWQGLATYRSIKNSDYSWMFICLFMSLLTLMEREGLMPWYNLTLLYPLAEAGKACGGFIDRRRMKKEFTEQKQNGRLEQEAQTE